MCSRCYSQSFSYFQSAKSVEALHENIKQIEYDLKLQDNSKTEVRQADNAKGEKKIVHSLLYPDSFLFKRWGTDLREEEQTVAQNLFIKYGYNVYLSDRLPLDRPIRDTRSPRYSISPLYIHKKTWNWNFSLLPSQVIRVWELITWKI